ncbi:MAG TPA: hypothetical protein VMW42_10250 [Desulfatiglandales bacterium]|nr:hypothetical protein [Desulfatiglandales bacterium]
MPYEFHFLLSLAVTVSLETVMLFIIVRFFYKIDSNKVPIRILLFLGVFCSFSTLPYLWFFLPAFIKSRNLFLLTGETGVAIIESVIYYFILGIGFKRSLALSFCCNAVSFLAGYLLPNI